MTYPMIVVLRLSIRANRLYLYGAESIDRQLGNREGWAEFNLKTLERGAATHVYAAFDPTLKGASC
jgi:hypothetical protein